MSGLEGEILESPDQVAVSGWAADRAPISEETLV
jgi:hypothetical protein